MNRSSRMTATVGIDIGDVHSEFCVLDNEGEVVERGRFASTRQGLEEFLAGRERLRVALEVGTHSPWMSRIIKAQRHEVLVANARKLQAIYRSDSKNDRTDAEMLARIARLDPKLLAPVRHRSAQAQADLAVLRARDALVRLRTGLINHVRGAVKAAGYRLPSASSEAFVKRVAATVPQELYPALEPVLQSIEQQTSSIRGYDRLLDQLARERYPQTAQLMQVVGVGPVTALSFILTLEDPKRFRRSRQVGAYLGLRPRQDQSGNTERQLHITKAGDGDVRRLLVQAGQYILGPFAPESDLRRWGLAIAERGGKKAKKRAVIAVARKLAVLLHALWKKGTTYEPVRTAAAAATAIATATGTATATTEAEANAKAKAPVIRHYQLAGSPPRPPI